MPPKTNDSKRDVVRAKNQPPEVIDDFIMSSFLRFNQINSSSYSSLLNSLRGVNGISGVRNILDIIQLINHIINDEINWLDGTAEISQADIDAKKAELQAKEDNRPNAKASAKAKLIAGEPLTEEEADAIVY